MSVPARPRSHRAPPRHSETILAFGGQRAGDIVGGPNGPRAGYRPPLPSTAPLPLAYRARHYYAARVAARAALVAVLVAALLVAVVLLAAPGVSR